MSNCANATQRDVCYAAYAQKYFSNWKTTTLFESILVVVFRVQQRMHIVLYLYFKVRYIYLWITYLSILVQNRYGNIYSSQSSLAHVCPRVNSVDGSAQPRIECRHY